MDYIQFVQLFFSLLIVVAVVVLLLKQKHSTGFTVMWIIIALGTLIFGLFPDLSFYASAFIGISYPPTLILIIAVTLIIGNLFYLYSQIMNSKKQILELSMQVALLNEEVAKLKKDAAPEAPGPFEISNVSRGDRSKTG